MYKRLRDGLLSPKSIVGYISDKMYKPFIQLILYAVLMTIPFVISTINYKGLEYDEELEIREIFDGEVIPFKVVDGTLESVNDKSSIYKKEISQVITVIVTIDKSNKDFNYDTVYAIVFDNTKIYISCMGIEIDIGEYTTLEGMVNISFVGLGNPNSEEWKPIISVINKVMVEVTKKTAVASTIFYLIESYVYLLFVALLLSVSFRLRFRNVLNYKSMLKMSMYYTCPFVICYILASLFDLAFLVWIGIILSFVYVTIGSSVIIKKLVNQGRE